MLFGDWGTSRLYVLGLALFYSAAQSFYHVLAMCLLMTVVAWAYTVVCRCFQDGGGVYSAARAVDRRAAVIGALLLFASYVVTAAISAVTAFRYLGASVELAPKLAVLSIFVIGVINFVGPRNAGRLATLIAVATLAITLILAAFCLPHLPAGWANLSFEPRGIGKEWISFVHIILALSGVEAVANMTGVMVQPVGRTSKRAIWPVLGEVVVFNLLFGVAMLAAAGTPLDVPLADEAAMGIELTEQQAAYRDTILDVLANQYVNKYFAQFASFVFAMLLLSAVNTAVAGMVSVQFVMARDNELPPIFTRLNAFGVPWIGLVVACVVSGVLLLVAGEVDKLGHLYAIGVVGAIATNLISTCFNRHVSVAGLERVGIAIVAAFLVIVELTIIGTQWRADLFVLLVLAGGYLLRFGMKKAPEVQKHLPRVAEQVGKLFQPPPMADTGELFSDVGLIPFDPTASKILVATRGNPNLLRFAAEEAAARKANLIVLFVRDLRVPFGPPVDGQYLPENDPEALPVFSRARELVQEKKVPYMPIYCVARSPAEMILDFAGTYAADYVIMGVTRRGALYRALKGDVMTQVAENLPAETTLLLHA